MSGIIIDATPHSTIKVRWDVTPGCVTITQGVDDDFNEMDIPVEKVGEIKEALIQQAASVRPRV